MQKLYPIKFRPILKSMIWGGNDIPSFKNIETDLQNIGESWEVSGVKGNISVVSEGPLAGKSLIELISEYQENLLGRSIYNKYGETFPLLIKFIDAKKDLSIQVHPDDELARQRHNSFGKTEMWYVIDASDDAFLYTGFEKKLTPDEYIKTVADKTFTDSLKRYDVKQGDVFYLPAGRVHAIGAGCFIAEIQQTSDITYRIYDYDRKDANGNARELHTELAKDAINFEVLCSYKTEYQTAKNEVVALADGPYFETNLIEFDSAIVRNYSNIDSFVLLICVKGNCNIATAEGDYKLNKGETVLIPAEIKDIKLIPDTHCKLIETSAR